MVRVECSQCVLALREEISHAQVEPSLAIYKSSTTHSSTHGCLQLHQQQHERWMRYEQLTMHTSMHAMPGYDTRIQSVPGLLNLVIGKTCSPIQCYDIARTTEACYGACSSILMQC